MSFRTRQSSVYRRCTTVIQDIFWQGLSGRIFSDRFSAVASRTALSRPPASVGYHRCRDRRFTPLLKQFQNSVWPCTSCSIPGWTYVDYRKENAYFPAIVLLSIPFCCAVLSSVSNFNESRVIYAIRRFVLHGSSNYMGFRGL
jgi:hypothetical protein